MATQNLLNLARRSGSRLSTTTAVISVRYLSTTIASAAGSKTSTFAATPPVIHYDHIVQSGADKIKRVQDTDPRFLRYASPHATLTDHGRILSVPVTRVTTLPNGLRVATESTLASKTATVGVWIDAGSRFETVNTSGTAHFLEHMIFKGTGKRTVRQLEEEIENMGGHLNAYTSREQTTYYANVLDKDVPKALDILADILQNSKFERHRINRERDVILREMESVEQNPEEVIFDHLHSTAFQHTPLSRTILGPVENIKTITKEDIVNYISTHYSPSRMVVSATGAVKHVDIVEQVKKLFTKLSNDTTTSSELVSNEPSFFTGSEVRIQDDQNPLAHFAVAFKGVSWVDPDSIALMVMQTMLGSWNKNAGGGKHMGSELVQRIAIDGIAESMMAFNTNYKDIGLFGVYAAAKPDDLEDLAFAIMNEISKLSYHVSEADVTRACNQLKSSLQLHIDGSSPIAEDVGRQLLTYGRRIPVPEIFARIDAVDVSTIIRVANRLMFDQDIAIAAMGSIKKLPDYNWFRRRTVMLCH